MAAEWRGGPRGGCLEDGYYRMRGPSKNGSARLGRFTIMRWRAMPFRGNCGYKLSGPALGAEAFRSKLNQRRSSGTLMIHRPVALVSGLLSQVHRTSPSGTSDSCLVASSLTLTLATLPLSSRRTCVTRPSMRLFWSTMRAPTSFASGGISGRADATSPELESPAGGTVKGAWMGTLGRAGTAGAVVAVGIRGTEWLFQLLWPGENPLFFDLVPIRWFFDASEALILIVFVVFGTWEAIEMLRR
jgi:hypothetical protein